MKITTERRVIETQDVELHSGAPSNIGDYINDMIADKAINRQKLDNISVSFNEDEWSAISSAYSEQAKPISAKTSKAY